ncbi:MAG: NADP-dependent oxidoreductase [Caulobacteraceae bacterium]|nr:NADP-dependent oxidoreductase [Caulobacteraceae bacterium]
MPQLQNRQVKLAARPVGNPKREDFSFETAQVAPLEDGEVLVRVSHLSLDPAMRGWMNAGRSYIPPVELGEVMRAGGAGEVVESRHDAFRPGDQVTGITGVQQYAAIKGERLQKVDTARVPLESYLGGLGMPGMTAYFGLLDVCAMKEGDTVVVSGAAGAVGSIVGQLARIKGGRAIGIAGGADKCRFVVEELGFDACVDYKSEDVAKRLRELCPDRINVYFDNVGGEILDICLAQIAFHGRIGICGAISQYNSTTGFRGPANYMSLLVNRARMEGFVVFDFAKRYGEAVAAMAGWMAEGKLKVKEHVVEAPVDQFVETLGKLFAGENLGKMVMKIG